MIRAEHTDVGTVRPGNTSKEMIHMMATTDREAAARRTRALIALGLVLVALALCACRGPFRHGPGHLPSPGHLKP